MTLDFVTALGKRATLFSYSRSVENIVNVLLREGS